MKVFVTGGSGYVGSAIVRELVAAGHQVTGLARSEAAAARLRALGAAAAPGEIGAPQGWRDLAAAHQALIHAAIQYGPETAALDALALDGLLGAAAAGGRVESLILTSGVWVVGETGGAPTDESASTARPAAVVAWRPGHERRVLEAARPDLATAVIRPGTIYGGAGGTLAGYFARAEKDGVVTFVGDGENRWTAVHCDDVASLFRRVAEQRARGVFHAVADGPHRVADIAAAASAAAGCGGATRSWPLEQARPTLGPVADALVLDLVVTAPRSLGLGWRPSHASVVAGAAEAYREWREAREARAREAARPGDPNRITTP